MPISYKLFYQHPFQQTRIYYFNSLLIHFVLLIYNLDANLCKYIYECMKECNLNSFSINVNHLSTNIKFRYRLINLCILHIRAN